MADKAKEKKAAENKTAEIDSIESKITEEFIEYTYPDEEGEEDEGQVENQSSEDETIESEAAELGEESENLPEEGSEDTGNSKTLAEAKKKRKIIVIACLALVLLIGAGAGGWYYLARPQIEPKEVVVELGQELSKNPKDYFTYDDKIKNVQLNTATVNIEEVGKYEVILIAGTQRVNGTVIVEDTTAPEVVLSPVGDGQSESNNNAEQIYEGIVGKEIPAETILAETADLAGILSVEFAEAQVKQDKAVLDKKTNVPDIKIKYDQEGIYENKIIVTDNNGNQAEAVFKIDIVADYAAHVTGIEDISIVRGTDYNWLEGVETDERIKEITVDDSEVDIDTVGEYTLKYVVLGDNDKTKVEIEVKVTVTEQETVSNQRRSETESNSNSGDNNSTNRGNNRGNNGPSTPVTPTPNPTPTPTDPNPDQDRDDDNNQDQEPIVDDPNPGPNPWD